MAKAEVHTKGEKPKPSFNAVVKSWIPAMERVLPKHLTGERMFTLMTLLANKSPALRECMETERGQLSLYTAIMNASKLGLEIGQHAHIVPFKNSRGNFMEAVFIADYRGLIHLAVSSGKVRHLDVRSVFKGDEFDYGLGDTPYIKHKPKLGGGREPEDLVAVYTVGHLADGTKAIGTPMAKSEVDVIRARSRAGKDGPWVTDYEAMAKKTVVKRDAKFLPQTPELQAAIELDTRGDTGEIGMISNLIDSDDSMNQSVADNAKEKAAELAERLNAEKPAQAGEQKVPAEAAPSKAEESGNARAEDMPHQVPAAASPAPAKSEAKGKGDKPMF